VHRSHILSAVVRLSLISLALLPCALAAQAPPNAPATLARTGDRVTLSYAGRAVYTARLAVQGDVEFRTLTDTTGGRVTQVFKWTARGPQARLTLSGTVRGSDEAFPVEAEPREDALPLVRVADGLSTNRLNRAVYDRRRDWLLSVDVPAGAVVTPVAQGGDSTVFALEASGFEVALRFRSRFYSVHRGLTRFAPWTYRVRRGSVAGWTSWFAFFDRVTEDDIRRTAEVVSEVLKPFGYDVLQIDDGYQREPIGVPANWLNTNDKFPGGVDGLRTLIAARGLTPGIWTNTTFHDRDWALAHPRFFVRAPEGGPAYGNWVGYVMDGAAPGTLDTLVRPVYRELARQGWGYFKVDALRHLRYEGYNSFAEDFRRRGLDRETVYRDFVQAIRDAIGAGPYLLACWGIRPELAGIVDAVRVGTDGFGYGGFAQYNSFNNVVWRNDPDHIEIAGPDGYRAATITSLTGSLLMLTDKPETYRTPRVEAALRTAPVLFTLPGQVYDVDPSRSSVIAQADVATSGSGPRPLDADRRLAAPLYLLDVARSFERWSVLARAGGDESRLRFRDLGIAEDREHLVFEFWTHTLLGAFQDGFAPGPIDARYGVQVFCIRDRLPRPQLVATNRHVSCGGVDLVDVSWRDSTLTGQSDVVAGDGYALYVTEPPGWRFVDAQADGATVESTDREGALRVVRLRSAPGGRVTWRARFAPAG
jgi:alpha-galactosidase